MTSPRLASLLALTGFLSTLASAQQSSFEPITWEGFYTDRVTYAPGDTIRIHGNWENQNVKYFTRRIDAPDLLPFEWTLVDESPAVAYGALVRPGLGSFVRVPGLTLDGRNEFTIEGWFRPTYTNPASGGGDFVVLAGQATSASNPEPPETDGEGAWIGISREGRLCAGVWVWDPNNTSTTLITVEDSEALLVGKWHYLAVTFDSTKLRLYRATPYDPEDEPGFDPNQECVALRDAQPIPVEEPTVEASSEFRVGARAEAPGDMTGCADGRFDRWSVWTRRLPLPDLQARMKEGRPTTCEAPVYDENMIAQFRADYLELELDFEVYGSDGSETYPDSAVAYNSAPPTASEPICHGVIVNHGTPGVAGPAGRAGSDCDGKALRLNHDQIVDAGFPVSTEVQIPGASDPGSWDSGLYVIQAVFEKATQPGFYGPAMCKNLRPEHFATFVLRPPAGQAREPVAVVVPTNAWIAYNSWPGASTRFALGSETAPDMTLRPDLSDPTGNTLLPQGNNSVYEQMGDGSSPCHYGGWLRPNLLASPILKRHPDDLSNYCLALDEEQLTQRPLNDQGAYLALRFFEWLAQPIGGIFGDGGNDGILDGEKIAFDAFSDCDLDDGTLLLTSAEGVPRYQVLMLFGKPEYFSKTMLDELNRFVDSGGNVISVAGNSIVWRSELFSQASGVGEENRILEVRKWPNIEVVGFDDERSLKDGELTGNWRYVLQQFGGAFTGSDTPWLKDYVLGTLPFGGNTCKSGYWKARNPAHWLWEDLDQDNAILSGPGHIVGEEQDSYLCNSAWAGSLPDTLPGWNEFPFSQSGTVEILADGDFVTDNVSCAISIPAYNDSSFTSAYGANHASPDCSVDRSYLNGVYPITLINPQTSSTRGFGQIVFYEAKAGGRVLNVASINSVLGLRYWPMKNPTGPNRLALSLLVERVLLRMTGGASWPASVVALDCED